MNLTVAQLRKEYPSPRIARQGTGADLDDEYCVGGALCLKTRVKAHFPDDEQIAEGIRRATDGRVNCYMMTDFWHEKFHAKIDELVACNDTGQFERAWKILGQLLNWKHLKASPR